MNKQFAIWIIKKSFEKLSPSGSSYIMTSKFPIISTLYAPYDFECFDGKSASDHDGGTIIWEDVDINTESEFLLLQEFARCIAKYADLGYTEKDYVLNQIDTTTEFDEGGEWIKSIVDVIDDRFISGYLTASIEHLMESHDGDSARFIENITSIVKDCVWK